MFQSHLHAVRIQLVRVVVAGLPVTVVALGLLLVTVADRGNPGDVSQASTPVKSVGEAPVSVVPGAAAQSNWLRKTGERIGRSEYEIGAIAECWQAPNRALGLRTYFRRDGIDVIHRSDHDDVRPIFAWRTSSWGRDERMRAVGPATVEPAGSRVEYRYRGGFTEWYENRPDAIEQGWQVAARPAGEGELVIAGRLSAGARTDLAADGRSMTVRSTDGYDPIRYGDLHVFDGRGSEIPARFAVVGARVEIRIDDRGAIYPLSVDPTITPAWSFNPANGAFYDLSHLVFATAGDVDGDGYSDVVVGVDDFDDGQSNEGAVFVFHGRPTGLQSSWDWAAYGEQAGAHFGSAVSTAGDVDGDGFGDIVVGAALWDEGQYYPTDRGKVCVYLGGVGGLADEPVWSRYGIHTNARLGLSVDAGGDVNGDSYDDVLVSDCNYLGAPRSARFYAYLGSSGGPQLNPCWTDSTHTSVVCFGTAGDVDGNGRDDIFLSHHTRVHVYHGNSLGIDALPTISLAPHYAYYESYGYAASTAGDVNGDGYSDLVVGDPTHRAPIDEPPYWIWYGRAMIYHGSEDGLAATPAWDIVGDPSPQVGTAFGIVSTAGDVNGDGYADVIVSEPAYDAAPELARGRFFVYLGAANGCQTTPHLQAEATTGIMDFGGRLAAAGDVNGDGFGDLLVGATANPGGGLVFAFYGASLPPADVPVLAREGDGFGRHLGRSLAAAGDYNGDGHGDVVVGVPGYYNAAGRVEVYAGSETGAGTSPAWSYTGSQFDAQLGFAVAAAGDVDGDGYTDIVVGEPYRDSNRGRVLLFLGSNTGLPAAPNWTAIGTHEQERFGYAVAWAGDVNRDGYADVIVGAPGYTNGEGGEGRAVLYFGSPAGLVPSSWQYESNVVAAGLGFSVAGAGDVDKNGHSDVLVGAPYYTDTLAQQGRVLLFRGSSIGLAADPAWSYAGEQTIAFLGWSVAGAGDVNGDGYSDVLVGAPGHGAGAGLPSAGKAYIFRGYSLGIQEPALWTAIGPVIGQQLGWSVAPAGDVNCDRCSDVLIGLPGGARARLYYGQLYSAPGSTPDWEVTASAGSAFGACVAMAGDANADGFGDILVGAPDHDGGMDEEGAFRLYLGNGKAAGNLGLTIHAMQYRPGYDHLDLLGDSNDPNGVVISVYGRSAAGRSRLRLETRLATMDYSPLNMPVHRGDWYLAYLTDWGAYRHLDHQSTNLAANTDYHWQLRVASDSPFFPHSPWFTMPRSAAYQKHFKTAGGTGLPDLRVVQIDPDEMPAGSPVTVTIQVRNDGPGAAGASTTSLALDGATQCGAIPTPAIMAGVTATIACQLAPVAAGLHQLTACADAGDDVFESSEGNNCAVEELAALSGDEIVVDPGGGGDVTTIAAALAVILDGGVIELVPGTYSGNGNRDLDFAGLNVTLRSQSRNRETCTIDCGGSAAEPHRAFIFHSGEGAATVIEGITITGGYADAGGAIHCTGSSPTLREVIFSGNYATGAGGAVYLDGSSPAITDCEFAGNSCGAQGGGLAASNASAPTIAGCRFAANSGHGGGGFYLNASAATITGCTVIGNDADWGGGGYCTQGADASITGCTFAGNTGVDGGAAFSIVTAAPVLANCILAFNAGPGQVVACSSGGDASLACCDVFGNDGGDWVGCLADQLGVDGNICADPEFCDLAGGDVTLQSTSPCAEENSPGCGRIGSLGVGCGFHHLLRADGSGDFPTIQAALEAAAPRDVIELASGTYTGDGNRDLDFGGKPVTVRSQSGIPDYCIIDCQGTASENHRGFYFHSAEGPDAELRGITITGGYAYSGGGVLITGGSQPTISDCVFLANHSAGSGGGGGGLSCSAGSATVTNCRFANNSAANAGGGLSVVGAAPSVTDCWFGFNTAVWGGGGVYNNNGTPVFAECIFVGNTCDHWGGGLHSAAAGAHTVVDGCTFSANAAPQGGGLYDRTGAQTTLTNTIIAFSDLGGAVYCAADAGPVALSCCDLFGNAGGDWTGCIADQADLAGNLGANPLFCALELGDLTLAADSPCLPANNDCDELIGALGEGCASVTAAGEDPVPMPAVFALGHNYPNPFNPATTIAFDLPCAAHVELAVFSLDGRRISTLVRETLPAGRHTATWDATDERGCRVASGAYFYRVVAGEFVGTERMLLLK